MGTPNNPPDKFVAFYLGRSPIRVTLIAPGEWKTESWINAQWLEETVTCDRTVKTIWNEAECYEYQWPEQ